MMNSKIRSIEIYLVAMSVFFIALASACSTTAPTSTPVEQTAEVEEVETTPPPAPDEKITVSWGTIGYRDFAEEFFLETIAQYEAENPNVKIEWIDLPGQYREWFLSSLVAGDLPDVVDMHRVFGLADWASMGALANLDELLSDEEHARYPEGLWQGGSFDGVSYAIPWWGASRNLWYNPDLLSEAGIDNIETNPPQTYEDLFEIGRIVHEQTGNYGVGFYISDYLGTGMLVQEGVEYFTSDGAPAINSPQAREALQMWVDAYADGVFPPEAVSVSEDTDIYANINWFVAGQTAFDISGSTASAFFPDDMSFTPGFLPAVTGAAGLGPEFGGHYLVITEQSQDKEAALDFALFVAGDETQLRWAQFHTSLPTSIQASNDPQFTEAEPETIGQQARLLEIADVPRMFTLPLTPGWSEMVTVLKEQQAKAFLGEVTVEEALATVELRWNEIIERQQQ